jgi:hypothetical protein
MPMSARYEQAQREYKKFALKKRLRVGPDLPVFELHADLQTLTPPKMPAELLERCVFEKITIRGRALASAVDLIGAIDGLEKSIKYRNDLIAEIQKLSPVPPKLLAEKYLALKNEDGIIDEKFRASLTAIVNQTDDCIFFSQILADDLLTYGKRFRRKHSIGLRLGLPKLQQADWSVAKAHGLIPPAKLYASWLSGFKERKSPWKRFASWVSKRRQRS